MNAQLLKAYQASLAHFEAKYRLDGGLVIRPEPGHTKDAARGDSCHCGRTTSTYFCHRAVCGVLSEAQAEEILSGIEGLQIVDQGSPQYGGFRWYGEDERINDSNAAFFILMPMATTLFLAPDAFSGAVRERVMGLLTRGGHWFAHELRTPILYYSNKILSDGGLMAGIGSLTGNEQWRANSVAFFRKWLDYTHQRGWGWGENTSLGYNTVIFYAIGLALRALGAFPEGREVCERLRGVLRDQLDYFAYHDGYEPVPQIRTYNAEGRSRTHSLVYNLAGVPGHEMPQDPAKNPVGFDALAMLFADDLFREKPYAPPPAPRKRVQRVFDDAYAVSYIGKNGSIGSLTRFPVIEGSYQHKTWGVGWQTQPVCYNAFGQGTGYLRFRVHDGEQLRLHPGVSFASTYLSPALFSESAYPDVRTRSVQDGPALVCVRSMDRLNHRAQQISDEWAVHGAPEVDAPVNGFAIVRYKACTIFIAALPGCGHGHVRLSPALAIEQESAQRILLRQTLYEGPAQVVSDERVYAAWAAYFVDNALSAAEAASLAGRLSASARSYTDGIVPREFPAFEMLDLSVALDGKPLVSGTFDPYM